MKKLLIRLGFHGVRHQIREVLLIEWMHNNGVGA